MVSIWPHGANTYPRMQCVQVRFNQACKSTGRAEIVCKIFLQVWNVRSIMQPLLFPIPKKIQGVAIISKHSYQKFFFLRAFQAPLKSNIKFQGFSRTSRSSMNHVCLFVYCFKTNWQLPRKVGVRCLGHPAPSTTGSQLLNGDCSYGLQVLVSHP